ncbi:MAG: ABC transporter ATP-binding protein [Betaproteobacteria bacterium]|jgi:ABC-type polysaccharide/polyol phosphate transport system ATPase subunit
MAAVQLALHDVSLVLPIYNPRGRALKGELLRRTVGGRIGDSGDPRVVLIEAVNRVTLEFMHGERVALLGRNGAGKSTLLRLLGGIYPPTSGLVTIRGRVSSLTDMSMGMDMEATGYENVVLRGVVMGLTRRAARALTPDIEAFTELGNFLNLPVRTYSTGMLLRLAFAISTAVQPDILLLDEMVGAGDAAFIDKARQRIGGLIERASVMVLASHDEELVRQLCNRALWLDAGAVRADGPVDEVLASYRAALR